MRMLKKIFLAALLISAFIPRVGSVILADDTLTQYGEISSVYNDEVKIRCRDPLSHELYYFKFYIGWDTTFEGLDGKGDLKTGDFINVDYKMDMSQKPVAVKISLPKELTPRATSRSGQQPYDEGNNQIKNLQDEVKRIWAEIDKIKDQLKENQEK
jgi:peptidoglycan hydrolase CwlO-like protein